MLPRERAPTIHWKPRQLYGPLFYSSAISKSLEWLSRSTGALSVPLRGYFSDSKKDLASKWGENHGGESVVVKRQSPANHRLECVCTMRTKCLSSSSAHCRENQSIFYPFVNARKNEEISKRPNYWEHFQILHHQLCRNHHQSSFKTLYQL